MLNMFNMLMLAEGETVTKIPYEVRQALIGTFMILMVLCSIALIVVVLMQKSTGENMQAIAGGSSDSFYGKNKSQSKEGKLKKTTVGLSVAMLLISVVFFIIQNID